MEKQQQLSRNAIEDFKSIYLEEFGVALSDDQVQEMAVRLLRFFGILTKPGFDKTKSKPTIGSGQLT